MIHHNMMQQKHSSSQCKNTNADLKHERDQQLPQHINSHKCTKMQTQTISLIETECQKSTNNMTLRMM